MLPILCTGPNPDMSCTCLSGRRRVPVLLPGRECSGRSAVGGCAHTRIAGIYCTSSIARILARVLQLAHMPCVLVICAADHRPGLRTPGAAWQVRTHQ